MLDAGHFHFASAGRMAFRLIFASNYTNIGDLQYPSAKPVWHSECGGDTHTDNGTAPADAHWNSLELAANIRPSDARRSPAK